jgi:uncharacterized integral membrane protein
MMTKIKLWTGGLLLLLLVIFILQNLKRLYVDFLFWEFHISRAFLIILMLLLGFLTGIAFPHLLKLVKMLPRAGAGKAAQKDAAPAPEKKEND